MKRNEIIDSPIRKSAAFFAPKIHLSRPFHLLSRHCSIILCSLLIFLMSHQTLAQYTTVPLDHQVYALLAKGETLQLFSSYALRILPLDRDTVHRLLVQMSRKRNRLSYADQKLLEQMLAEFTDPPPGRPAPPGAEIHALRFEEDEVQLFVDLRATQTFRFSRNRVEIDQENLSETRGKIALRGKIGSHLFFGAEATNTMIMGSNNLTETFDPSQGRIQVTVGRSIFTDQATGYLAYKKGRFGFMIGRNYLAWGSGLLDQLALSTKNEPMDMLRFTADFKRFRFAYTHARLQGIGDRRYLIGHRLDFFISKKVQLGIYETLVYAGRGIEPSYLNPLLPYHIMEHQLGDRDNNMVGFDLTALLPIGMRLYSEIFVDDFSLDFPLGTYWGNKLAYMVGLHWAQPLHLKTLELFSSYTRVDPFVYTHADSLNTYSHYGQSLGSRLGPNADRFQLIFALQPHRDVRWQWSYAFLRKGKGNLFVPHQPQDGPYKGFLRNPVEYTHFLSFNLKVQMKRDIFLGFDLMLQNRRNANRVPGLNQWERFGRFFLDINY